MTKNKEMKCEFCGTKKDLITNDHPCADPKVLCRECVWDLPIGRPTQINLAEKWKPVLKKCTEIPPEDWDTAARILDSSYKEHERKLNNLRLYSKDFVMDVLKGIRRKLLIKRNKEKKPINQRFLIIQYAQNIEDKRHQQATSAIDAKLRALQLECKHKKYKIFNLTSSRCEACGKWFPSYLKTLGSSSLKKIDVPYSPWSGNATTKANTAKSHVKKQNT